MINIRIVLLIIFYRFPLNLIFLEFKKLLFNFKSKCFNIFNEFD